MDFYRIKEKTNPKTGVIEIYPDFRVCRSKDLMIRGRSFYAIWDERRGLWSTDEYDVQRLVDEELYKYTEELRSRQNAITYTRYLGDYSTKSWAEFRNYINHLSDNAHQLDENVTFQNDEIKKEDYISKRLPYDLQPGGSMEAYDEMTSTLYAREELDKIEWAIGAIISGDAKKIQKFIVFYGEGGTGKSTMLNIIQKLFEGYYTTFEAKALVQNNNSFATEVFRTNPLVAIQHDGDLSKIEDNTKLNSIVSHEEMTMNEKFKSAYTAKTNCFLFLGTNKPVKITDAKSGVIRRLIDVHPTGKLIPERKYHKLYNQIQFELGAIAAHCLEKYHKMGSGYYSGYKPLDMMFQTDVFFNFVEGCYDQFAEQEGITLSRAYEIYKNYCDESLVEYKLAKYKFREELKNYFLKFHDVIRIDGKQVRSYYEGFLKDKFNSLGGSTSVASDAEGNSERDQNDWLALESTGYNAFSIECSNCSAQYATEKETPTTKWSECKTILKDIDSTKLHYVKPPINHIVIDFDIKDSSGNKSLERNIEAASKWPRTYAEVSKGGNGLHLHYIYDGDPEELSNIYTPDIEIKVFKGMASLRRKCSKYNHEPISHIGSGLPRKEKKMIEKTSVDSEKRLRALISGNLRKEYHPGTKPSVDFIYKLLEDAYNGDLFYDVTDLRPKILAFANNSTNHSEYCVDLVKKMHFMKESPMEGLPNDQNDKEAPIAFFDIEVFPNLFLVCWKRAGVDEVHRVFNPTPAYIEDLLKMRLIGYNNRQYDNHMLYAAYIGYSVEQLYQLSQRIIADSKNSKFGNAYNLSYTDVYDFASAGNKKSLKKFEIELGIHHHELGFPWDQPVDKSKWDLVAEYCEDDVKATEAVFYHLSADWAARQILAELSGLSVNDTTNSHSTKIIFGDNKKPQDEFVYTELSTLFPGYKFENGKSIYRGEEVGEGGYVYSEPGIYGDVALLDVASMHPTSIEQLNLFGDRYTKRFSDIKQARIAMKHNDMAALENMLDGRLVPIVNRPGINLKDVANALKTVINSVYGLTSAKFVNPFRDIRNVDNIVAKRGALFMVDLKHAVQEKGFTVAHIKTDSIKIPNATPEIIQFVMEFGKKYGYEFEHEATYDRMCLVNDAVYIARYKNDSNTGDWTATGAQFQHPYVFKKLFTHEDVKFQDLCETKSVKSAIYLDMNESLPEGEHNYVFVGKVGSFCPIKLGCGGGILVRQSDDKYYAVTGSTGYRWLESELVDTMGKTMDVDTAYHDKLAKDAIDTIEKFGSFGDFVDVNKPIRNASCGRDNCFECGYFVQNNYDWACKLGYDPDNILTLPF